MPWPCFHRTHKLTELKVVRDFTKLRGLIKFREIIELAELAKLTELAELMKLTDLTELAKPTYVSIVIHDSIRRYVAKSLMPQSSFFMSVMSDVETKKWRYLRIPVAK